MAYSYIIPYEVERLYYGNFSMQGQPRNNSSTLSQMMEAPGIRRGCRIGLAGYKYYEKAMEDKEAYTFDVPYYIVRSLHRAALEDQISDRTSILRDGNYIGTFRTEEMSEDKLVVHMVGRKIDEIEEKKPVDRKDKLMELRGYTKEGNFADVDFTLYKGEVVGLTGLVGAGRSELFKSVFGITRPDAGHNRKAEREG